MTHVTSTTDTLTLHYESGRRARRAGCYRVLCVATDAERYEWLRGYDDEDAAMKAAREPDEPSAFVKANFDRLTSAIGLPLTREQERTLWWLASMERTSCDVIAHLFERVRAVPDDCEAEHVR